MLQNQYLPRGFLLCAEHGDANANGDVSFNVFLIQR